MRGVIPVFRCFGGHFRPVGGPDAGRPSRVRRAACRALSACEKIVASEGRSRCILGAPSRANPWPWLPTGAQDRFAGSETKRKSRRGEPQMGRAPRYSPSRREDALSFPLPTRGGRLRDVMSSSSRWTATSALRWANFTSCSNSARRITAVSPTRCTRSLVMSVSLRWLAMIP